MHLNVTGAGTVAVFDLASYALAVPLLMMNWRRMGKFMRRSVLFGLAWMCAAMLANCVYYVEFRWWLKLTVVMASSWTIMVVAYVLLKNHPKLFMWYLVGTGIGGWIALYHFQNGALAAFAEKAGGSVSDLMDKQVYPSVARGLLFGCVLPLFLWMKRFPIILMLGSVVAGGFYLLTHGGSRSNFGIFCAAAGAGFVAAYGKQMFRQIAKSKITMLLTVSVGIVILFTTYKVMVKTGAMGEGELDKYNSQFEEDNKEGAISGRAGVEYAVDCALTSGGIGLGGQLRCHSVMMNALACEGVVGFLFWVYFYWQLLWWVCARMPYSGRYTAFIALMMISAAWDALGSPFGTRHKFFVLMAFIAICRDNPYYGIGTLFDPVLLKRMWRRPYGR